MSSNVVGDDAFIILMLRLKSLTSIRRLKLDCMGLTVEGVEPVVPWLAKLTNLQLLSLWEDDEFPDASKALKPLPEVLSSLKAICVNDAHHNFVQSSSAVFHPDIPSGFYFSEEAEKQTFSRT